MMVYSCRMLFYAVYFLMILQVDARLGISKTILPHLTLIIHFNYAEEFSIKYILCEKLFSSQFSHISNLQLFSPLFMFIFQVFT